jgi:type IV secretory pathway TraG/TraD family ATPase VirD4
MDILEQAPAHARSYGIRFLIVIQDMAQLFRTYGRDTAIWGNIATKVFHGPVHDETAARMEQMLGPETVEVTSCKFPNLAAAIWLLATLCGPSNQQRQHVSI